MPSSTQEIAYHEPKLVPLLIASSFLYLLNVVRVVADNLCHAGIVAQLALGMVYGSPLASIVPHAWEETFTVLGYLGLILLVFEGGLTTNLPVLLSNLPLSLLCAFTGIALPIALSLGLLTGAFHYSPLHAFLAGAALSSTSLGTTLAALNSVTRSLGQSARSPGAGSEETASWESASALQDSRVGTVLVSAAIIDDVIGLVIASFIPALASTSQSANASLAWTIVKPLLSSFLIAVVSALLACFVLRPLFWFRGWGERWCAPRGLDRPWGLRRFGDDWGSEGHADAVKLLLMVVCVSAYAAITSYTGSSVLYGAYIAGLLLAYISNPPPPPCRDTSLPAHAHVSECEECQRNRRRQEDLSFAGAFDRTIGSVQQHILAPLFFASIGFAIPFVPLWRGSILWHGIIYAVFMCIAKLAVGVPILIWTLLAPRPGHRKGVLRRRFRALLPARFRASRTSLDKPELSADRPSSVNPTVPVLPTRLKQAIPPALFVGVAMVSRGEIGLLILQLARGSGADGERRGGGDGLLDDEAFLVSVWAILLCTLVGPVGVGFLVSRWGSRINSGIWA